MQLVGLVDVQPVRLVAAVLGRLCCVSARFQGGTGGAKASALRDYLDLPAAADSGFCIGCIKYVNVQLSSKACVILLTSVANVRPCAS